MAATAIDLLLDLQIVAKAKETFAEEIGGSSIGLYCRLTKNRQ